jgi:hypothetical protein
MRDYAMVLKILRDDIDSHLKGDFFDAGNRKEAAAFLISRELFKKLAPSGQTVAAVDATVRKFLALNEAIPSVPRRSSDDNESVEYLLSLFQDEMFRLLDTNSYGDGCDLAFLASHFRSGPGASRGADARNFYSKLFDSDHTCTSPQVLALFRAAIYQSESWRQAYHVWSKTFRTRIVDGNSLFTVPKTSDISRTCCTEPLLNMLFQQAVGDFISLRLRERFGIDLSRQPDINRQLTRLGSIEESHDSFCTIDLSSASDSIAQSLCSWAIPPSVLRWVNLFRSPMTRTPSGQKVELRMVSTMGNGFTFPLETAIFASAVRAVYLAKGISLRPDRGLSSWSVFGDDIVVRKDCYESVIMLLKRLGFTVNVGKSFNSGPFRESCGYDMWHGHNIRAVHITSLETDQDVYSTFNRLARWSAENEVPLVRTLTALRRMAPDLRVPFSEADDSGIKVPGYLAPYVISSRYWRKYTKLEPVSTVESVPEGINDAQNLGYKGFNPYGWEIAYIGEYARTPDKTFSDLRDLDDKRLHRWEAGINRRPYQGEVLPRRRRTCDIPYWDWFGAQDRGRFSVQSLERWEALLEALLT